MEINREICPQCNGIGGYHLHSGPWDGHWQCKACGYVDRGGVTNSVRDWEAKTTRPGRQPIAPAPPPDSRVARLEAALDAERADRESAEEKAENYRDWILGAFLVLAVVVGFVACEDEKPTNPHAPDCVTTQVTECW